MELKSSLVDLRDLAEMKKMLKPHENDFSQSELCMIV